MLNGDPTDMLKIPVQANVKSTRRHTIKQISISVVKKGMFAASLRHDK